MTLNVCSRDHEKEGEGRGLSERSEAKLGIDGAATKKKKPKAGWCERWGREGQGEKRNARTSLRRQKDREGGATIPAPERGELKQTMNR